MVDPLPELVRQLLEWVAAKPRTYGETMEAWRTSCPRLSVWEDALYEGLVSVVNQGSLFNAWVVLSEEGRARLFVGNADTRGTYEPE